MKMHILDLGKRYVDEAALVSGIHSASLRNQNPPAQWVGIPVTATLVDYGGGYLLYDTGCHIRESVIADGQDKESPFVGTEDDLLPAQLARLGVDPDDVKYVVVSHLHCDHVGYLSLFRKAEILVAADEFANALKLYGLRNLQGPYKQADFDEFLAAGLNFRLLPGIYTDYEIAPGVNAVSFGPGHTFSLTGLFVSLPHAGNFLFTADALYRSENLGPPVRIPGLIYDSLAYVKSANYIAKYAEEHDAKIIFGHDARQFATLKTGEEFYD
jgi:glyoxylase-like metal-dependent hydrolase (beta-lactamase superfamily II)